MRIALDTNVLARTTPGPSSPAREVLRRAAKQKLKHGEEPAPNHSVEYTG